MTNFRHIVTLLLKNILVVFFGVGSILYGFQIISRYVFNNPNPWISPLINYLFIVSALYGSALSIQTNENIKIDVLKIASTNKWIKLFLNTVTVVVNCILVMVFSLHLKSEVSLKDSSAFYLPKWWLDVPLLVLFISSIFYYVNDVYCHWKKNPNKKKLS